MCVPTKHRRSAEGKRETGAPGPGASGRREAADLAFLGAERLETTVELPVGVAVRVEEALPISRGAPAVDGQVAAVLCGWAEQFGAEIAFAAPEETGPVAGATGAARNCLTRRWGMGFSAGRRRQRAAGATR